MLTTMLMREVAWETCQWNPVADAEAGILVRSIITFLTERKKLFWLTTRMPLSEYYISAMKEIYHSIVHLRLREYMGQHLSHRWALQVISEASASYR
jgi:hypothetical protein